MKNMENVEKTGPGENMKKICQPCALRVARPHCALVYCG